MVSNAKMATKTKIKVNQGSIKKLPEICFSVTDHTSF